MSAVPFLVSFGTFLIYSVFDGVSHGPLTARLIFVSLALFNLLRFPLVMFPTMLTSVINANVALGRIHKLLTSDELDSESVTKLESVRRYNRGPSAQDGPGNNDKDVAVQVTDGSFRWSSKDSVQLDNINFSTQSSEHLAIVGRVGSGKSSLLSALLGDMRKEKGNVVLCGHVAYVPQQPWIMNATLRSNVLFGLKYDESFYNRVIDACALRPDLDMLTAGDMTEIGEKGINLSGGQKARVSLARAVYARADVYILDDPLSAVDAHVARHLFDQVLGPAGLLKSRCRIHATNAIQFIGKCDSVLMLRDGQIAECGTVGDLMKKRGLVHGLIQEYGIADSATPSTSGNVTPSDSVVQLTALGSGPQGEHGDVSTQNRRSTLSLLPNASIAPIQRTGQLRVIADGGRGSLISEEVSAVGKVSVEAYIDYFRACTWSGIMMLLTPEAPEVIEDHRPERSWPEQGMVEFKNYSTRYREGLSLVLKDVSFSVRPREKVGIVGRTGAGKSSLTLALFRIIEAAEGQILLDGEDIAQYGLFDVRSKLSIIPQDPVLFAGTVRDNLDPFNTYSDQDIWRALEHSRLADFVRAKDERLEFVVTQGGENFSVGQRQLICLARALLKHAKVLVLDEATAAIDPESDAIIQDSIRKEFKDCTVLTIAHRLNTIIDSDRILVLDEGQVAEFDTPDALLAKEDGLFRGLWERANES
ncbi:hypothetical protein GGF41_001928 [Coemansia sp. RSA 2531]|nr:hypothetical protein GGF41_001928 [Coemansia sp. RSA 2531]